MKKYKQIKRYMQCKLSETKGNEIAWHLILIAIACVLGALIIGLLYTATKNDIVPTIIQKIKDFFTYGG